MKRKLVAILLACSVMMFGALALTACGSTVDKDISMSEFDSIKDGMTYKEVVDIVGCEGTELSSSNIDAGPYSVKTIMYTWEGNGGAGSNANVTFQNDKVTAKAQLGLK